VILLWGVPGDEPLDDVHAELARIGADARLLDQRSLVSATVTPDRGGATGAVTSTHDSIDLGLVGAAYIRPQARCGPAAGADAALSAWADLTSADVVNRPAAMAANHSKPYQLALIARLGFAVPDTLVTTDPDAARAFWRRHERVVYKSVSGVRSIVSQLHELHAQRFADVANAPTQFQQHIAGEDIRVHVVGDEVIATAIRSSADDYRYAPGAGAPLEMAEVGLPREVADRCRAATREMGLRLSGIDLRRTDDGRWFCFEVNPSPAFTFFERGAGQPIAAAVARLLVRLDAMVRAGAG
jgi:glutathione synthase/RimK-type ligase-like ATP-grasp enzyme